MCNHIVLTVDLTTFNDLSPFPPTLGPSVDVMGTFRKSITTWAKWWVPILVLLTSSRSSRAPNFNPSSTSSKYSYALHIYSAPLVPVSFIPSNPAQ